MRDSRRRSTVPNEAGFALIEVLVSGIVAVIAAVGVMALMTASVHSAGDQRNRSTAYGLAQEDQARLRAMRIPSLKNLNQTREVTVDGLKYTVKSTAAYVNDVTGVLSCGTGTSTADYVKVSSEVTWPNMSPIPPQVIKGIIAPPSGSLNPHAGTLTVSAENASGAHLAGISVSGTGTAGSFSGTTDSNGCLVLPEVAEGTYTTTINGGSGNYVNKDGEALPETRSVTVNPEATTTLNLYYDAFGTVPITFKTTTYGGSQVANKAENLIAFNTEMTTAKVFGTVGTRVSSINATPLYPFTTGDSFYAGACSTNNPGTGSAIVSLVVPAGATTATQTLVLPSLLLTVKKEGSTYSGAPVKVVDTQCTVGGQRITRNFTTDTSGHLPEPGLPWSTYEVCASAVLTETFWNSFKSRWETREVTKHETHTWEVHSTSGTTQEINLTTSDLAGAC